jgi:hypothetical protein
LCWYIFVYLFAYLQVDLSDCCPPSNQVKRLVAHMPGVLCLVYAPRAKYGPSFARSPSRLLSTHTFLSNSVFSFVLSIELLILISRWTSLRQVSSSSVSAEQNRCGTLSRIGRSYHWNQRSENLQVFSSLSSFPIRLALIGSICCDAVLCLLTHSRAYAPQQKETYTYDPSLPVIKVANKLLEESLNRFASERQVRFLLVVSYGSLSALFCLFVGECMLNFTILYSCQFSYFALDFLML